MLNPAFTATADRLYGNAFAIPDDIGSTFPLANAEFSNAREERLGAGYTSEVWARIDALMPGSWDWSELDVADVCSGAGFLSYHLLQRASPRSLTLLEVSPTEMDQARGLIASARTGQISFHVGDVTEPTLPDESFDVIIGNSFLHHFPDVPQALRILRRLLRPRGALICLHEPTPMAVTLESGRLLLIAGQGLFGRHFVNRLRYRGPDMSMAGAVDIWLFDIDRVEDLLTSSGFDDVRMRPRYVTRPWAVGRALAEQRPVPEARLARYEARDLRLARMRVLPKRFFGGLMFIARRR